MDVATISMPAEEARRRYEEYRDGLAGREPSDDDRGVMLGYQALARGRAVLSLADVFRRCPLDSRGRPKLAVGRAHWQWCHFEQKSIRAADGGGYVPRLFFAAQSRHIWSRGQCGRVIVPPPSDPAVKVTDRQWRAMVPMIPPNLRPAPSTLRSYHVLWEAEWEVAPRDPLLLRHLHGGLYAVMACWDLTEIERAVLARRL